MDFSVCTSVYRNDKPEYLDLALKSIINQTVPPNEIVLVIDGPISSKLEKIIQDALEHFKLKVIRLQENQGLGIAMKIGDEAASCELIARMDSDDIALSDRFEKQINCFKADENLSIVGGAITEFIDEPTNIVAKRQCPKSDEEIKKYMKSRCGLNHMTVMFKRSEILKVGNYQDWFWNEDYYLWIRMILANCKFYNLSDVLVNVRVGKDMYARRAGWRYFKSEMALQKYMRKERLISLWHFGYNVGIRFVIQLLMPNNLRGIIFRNFFRTKIQ